MKKLYIFFILFVILLVLLVQEEDVFCVNFNKKMQKYFDVVMNVGDVKIVVENFNKVIEIELENVGVYLVYG